jgi:hypothetical protein
MRTNSTHRSPRTLGSFICAGVAVLLASLLVSAASPATSTKFYSVSLAPTPTPAGSTVTITIRNCGAGSPAPCSAGTVSTQSLGSANVTITGFTPPQGPIVSSNISVVTAGGGPSSKNWSGTVVGSMIQLRNPGPSNTNALAPGESVNVKVVAPTVLGTYPTSTKTKQSNDFSGPPGNAFTNVASDPTLTVIAGPLAHFLFNPIPPPAGANPKAGVLFSVGVTAYDSFWNIKTDYAGHTGSGLTQTNATLAGNLSGTPVGCAGACTPSYGLGSWTSGSATASFTPYAAESLRHLTLTDGTVSANSNDFTVDPGDPYTLTFVQQPTETQVGATINLSTNPTGVRVKVQDRFANLIPGALVGIAIGANPVGGSLTGTTPRAADSSAVATFDNLKINKVGVGYTLVATSGSASATSKAIIVADSVTPCTTTCNGSASKSDTKVVVNAAGTTTGDTLGVALLASSAPPAGVCGSGFVPLGAGSFVDINLNGASTPSLTVTWQLDKSIVNAQPDNAASHFNICLGAKNLLDPLGTSTTGWTTKNGTAAVPVFDPVFEVMLFWGLMPDCPKQGTPTGPCILSKNKTQAGDVVIQFVKPYPWDANWHGG